MAQQVLDLPGRVLVHQVPAPGLGPRRAHGMPHHHGPWKPGVERGVGKDVAVPGRHRDLALVPLPPFGLHFLEVFRHQRVVGKFGEQSLGPHLRRPGDGGVAERRKRQQSSGEPFGLVLVGRAVALLPFAAGSQPGDLRGFVCGGAVVGIPGEVLGGELPVARHPPLDHPAQHLRSALAAVPRVQQRIEVQAHTAEVFVERRRGRVPGGPDGSLVDFHLRHVDQPPLRFVQLFAVARAVLGNAVEVARRLHQAAVRGVAPAVIGAGEHRGVALIVAADLHPPVPAGVQQHVDPVLRIPGDDDRFVPHAGEKEIAGLGDLALMAHQEPRAREDLLQLGSVDVLVDEDLAADSAPVQIDPRPVPLFAVAHDASGVRLICLKWRPSTPLRYAQDEREMPPTVRCACPEPVEGLRTNGKCHQPFVLSVAER